MSLLGVLLLVLLVVLLVGALPVWPYATSWGGGYHPSGVLAVVLLIVVILIVFGRL